MASRKGPVIISKTVVKLEEAPWQPDCFGSYEEGVCTSDLFCGVFFKKCQEKKRGSEK